MSERYPIEPPFAAAPFDLQVTDRLRAYEAIPFLDGKTVDVDAQSAGTFTVVHRLGRKPRGFMVYDVEFGTGETGDFSLYRRKDAALGTKYIELYTTLGFKSLTLWIF